MKKGTKKLLSVVAILAMSLILGISVYATEVNTTQGNEAEITAGNEITTGNEITAGNEITTGNEIVSDNIITQDNEINVANETDNSIFDENNTADDDLPDAGVEKLLPLAIVVVAAVIIFIMLMNILNTNKIKRNQ